jgi:hypothetical protein
MYFFQAGNGPMGKQRAVFGCSVRPLECRAIGKEHDNSLLFTIVVTDLPPSLPVVT